MITLYKVKSIKTTLSNTVPLSLEHLTVRMAHWQCSLYGPGTDRTENVFSIIACSLVAGKTTCPQSCSLATAVVLSPVYTAVTWQQVHMSQYGEVRKLLSCAVILYTP
jgi:hypothetical protein